MFWKKQKAQAELLAQTGTLVKRQTEIITVLAYGLVICVMLLAVLYLKRLRYL